MGGILVIEHEGPGGIVTRLFGALHKVTVLDPPAALARIASGARFDAIVCGVPEGGVFHEALGRWDIEQARKVVFIVQDSREAQDLAGLPNRCVPAPFALPQLCAAIEATLTGSVGGGGRG